MIQDTKTNGPRYMEGMVVVSNSWSKGIRMLGEGLECS